MQTRNQWKRPKDWKVVSAVAAASALGLSGLALAGPGDNRDDPSAIDLRERTQVTDVTQVTVASTVPSTVVDALRRVADSGFSASPDSPFDSPSLDSPSPDSPSLDSPSPDSPSPDSPSPDSPSPDSPSPDSWSADSSIDSWSADSSMDSGSADS